MNPYLLFLLLWTAFAPVFVLLRWNMVKQDRVAYPSLTYSPFEVFHDVVISANLAVVFFFPVYAMLG